MKKLFALTVIVGLALVAYGQAPQKMSYQCVVRNSAGALVASHAVGLKISILKGSATGTVVFSETYSPVPQTNANGLLTVEIGGGTASVGTFAGIDWSAGPYFLKTETDPAGGTSYTITGTTQLLSVPYALYAKTAANGFSGAWADIIGKPSFATVATSGSYNDLLNKPPLFSGSYNDLTNKPVLFDGTWTSLTGKPVLFDGTWTSLTGKPVLFDGTWTSLSGKPAGFADGTDNVDDADNSVTNEIQALSLSGTVLSLSSGGGSVTLPSSGGGDNWGTQTVVTNTTLTGLGTTASPLAVANTVITPSWARIQGIPAGFADGTDNIDDADNSVTNEIQTLNLSGTTLTLSSGGGSVTLPSSGGGDNWGTQVVVTDASLAGNGTTATPLMIPDNGVTAAKIASGAVTTAKILDGTVSNADLADNSVTTLKIADGTIATADLANSTVTTDKLGNLAVSAEKIQNGAVTSDKLAANSVTSAKITAAAVTGDKIAQAGATAGQALKWNGTTWAPAADVTGTGLTLPFSGTGTSGSPLFDITNLGTSGAISTFSSGNYGIWGESGSSSGIGVYGVNKTSSGTTYGVLGDVYSPTGFSGFFQGGKFYIQGNTGIGTQNPSAKLEVSGQVKITGGTPGAGKVLTSDGVGLATWQTPEVNLWLKNSNHIYYNAGNVGIGTTVPGTLLQVHSNITYAENVTPIIRISDNYKTWNIGLGDPGDRFSISSEDNIDRLTILKSNGYVGLGTTSPAAGLHIKANTWPGSFIYLESNSGSDAGIRFYEGTTPKWHIYNNAAAGGLQITNTGAGTAIFAKQSNAFVGIGTSNPQYILDVAGGINIIKGLSGAALLCNGSQAIWYNGTYYSWGYQATYNYFANKVTIGNAAEPAYMLYVQGNAYATGTWSSSDVRFKKNVNSIENALSGILRIRGTSFEFRKDEFKDFQFDEGTQFGFIAQELEDVFPEVVNTENNGYKSVNYNGMIPVLVEAIKEEQKIINDLKFENEQLKTNNDQVEAKLKQLQVENEAINARLEKIEALIGYSAKR